jgi:DNA-3-methyladenine glycosylase I
VKRLLGDAGIVRHRGKIEAAIANAQATVRMREEGTPLERLFWAHASGPRSGDALSKELRRAGFRFVGPTTAYAAMQACGVVNDHIPECWVRDAVEAERRSVLSDPLW